MDVKDLEPGDAFARMLRVLPAPDSRPQAVDVVRAKLSQARATSKNAVRRLEASLGQLGKDEQVVLLDLFFAYRAVNDWGGMIALHARLPPTLSNSRTMLEQLAFALNRAGHGEAAERVIRRLLNSSGSSSEAYGLLGRIQKDRWDLARREGRTYAANGLLDKAIDAYMRGVEANWQDIYPGINALTLMELGDRSRQYREQLLPVVRLSATQRLASGTPDYWDHATLLEIAVIGNDEVAARVHLEDAQGAFREPWELQTTARNLSLLREERERRGELATWSAAIEKNLLCGNPAWR